VTLCDVGDVPDVKIDAAVMAGMSEISRSCLRER
jgi:hypothetical protein